MALPTAHAPGRLRQVLGHAPVVPVAVAELEREQPICRRPLDLPPRLPRLAHHTNRQPASSATPPHTPTKLGQMSRHRVSRDNRTSRLPRRQTLSLSTRSPTPATDAVHAVQLPPGIGHRARSLPDGNHHESAPITESVFTLKVSWMHTRGHTEDCLKMA
jgi:hypothetical protein